MSTITVDVVAVDDPPPLADLRPLDVQMGERAVRMLVIERGTASGKPSVCFAVQKDDGSWFVWETTAGALLMAAAALRGACGRFGFEDLART